MSAMDYSAPALLYELTGKRVQRRLSPDGVWQWEGLPGWCVTIQPDPAAPLDLVEAQWWPQAVKQADKAGLVPLLLYRPHRSHWRAVWPAALHCEPFPVIRGCGYTSTLTAEPLTWWRVCRAWHHQHAPPP